MKRHLPDVEATNALAADLLTHRPQDIAGWTVLLEGDLGTGKSTFARALIKAMGHTGTVPSPTYTLVEPYQLARGLVYHVDLYRVAGEEELRYLGWTELEDGLRLVEWPDRAPGLVAVADLQVRLHYAGLARDAEITGLSSRGHDVVNAMD